MRPLYRVLLSAFGPQGWWPVTPPGGTVPRYRPGRSPRLTERERFEVAAGAILTQNTAWTNVVKALGNLSRARALSVRGISGAPLPRLERWVRPSGYFRQKARRLRDFARHVAGARGGRLGPWLSGPLETVRGELLELKGVGPETADSILLYAGGRPVFVVDAYTRRIGRRLGVLKSDDYERVRAAFEAALPRDAGVYQEMHALLVELAKRHCHKTDPDCGTCPLRGRCRYAAAAVTKATKVTKVTKVAALVLSFVTFFTFVSLVNPAAAAFYAAAGKVDITPDPDDTVWVAGYGDRGRKAEGVNDPLYARAVVVSDGQRTVALVSLDLIGFFREQVLEVRRRLNYDPAKQAVLIAATHTHSGPDTLGLWGRYPGVSGVDDEYLERIQHRTAALIRTLAGSLQEAELVSAVTPIEMKGLCRDSRDPVVLDPDLAVLKFVAKRDKKTIGTLVNWSCHPEVLNAQNKKVTADYPGVLCARLEEKLGGSCAFFSGSIGGLPTPDTPADDFPSMTAMGEALAAAAQKAVASGTRSEPASVTFESKAFRVPIENSKYLAFLPILSFGHKLYGEDGQELNSLGTLSYAVRHMLFRLKPEQLPQIETEVQRIDFGPVQILGVPGEIFPELVVGGFDGSKRFGYPVVSPANPAPPDLAQAPKGPYLKQRMKGKHKLVIGLANDEIGYIVPKYDFKTTPSLMMRPHPPGHHYEETNSVGVTGSARVVEAAEELLE